MMSQSSSVLWRWFPGLFEAWWGQNGRERKSSLPLICPSFLTPICSPKGDDLWWRAKSEMSEPARVPLITTAGGWRGSQRAHLIPWALKADTGKRQGKAKTRKGQDTNVEKGEGGRVKAYEGQRREKRQRQGWLTPVGFILSHATSSWSWDHLTDNLWVGKKFFKGSYSLMIF